MPGQFARALASEDIQVINRAAWALGNLQAVEAVPRLVSALITAQQQIIMVPVPGGQSTAGPASADGARPRPSRHEQQRDCLQTPPAVGHGVVAYGMSAVPWYQLSSPGVAPVWGSPPGSPANQLPEPKVATFTYRNVEVLAALQKLTGQDFGYDVDFLETMGRAILQPQSQAVSPRTQP